MYIYIHAAHRLDCVNWVDDVALINERKSIRQHAITKNTTAS